MPDFRRFLSNPASSSSFRFFVAILHQRNKNVHMKKGKTPFCFVVKLAALRMRTARTTRAPSSAAMFDYIRISCRLRDAKNNRL